MHLFHVFLYFLSLFFIFYNGCINTEENIQWTFFKHLEYRSFSTSSYSVDSTPTPPWRLTPTKMTSSEAFTETMVANGVTNIFGIVGSAFMDALDIFPEAGIRFISVQHEQNAVHMADGFSRVTNKPGVCIAQNGPGITNFVTGVAAAYWAHSPVVVITPETGSLGKGLGGFQV